MAVHDWTKVSPGIYHHFHNAWIVELARALNSELLPENFYALAEQVAGKTAPDVIALEVAPDERSDRKGKDAKARDESGGVSVAMPPPRAAIVAKAENVTYASLRKTVVIRHSGDHEVVALIEILSHANKASRSELGLFLQKAQSALKQNIHLLLVDLYPPGRLDPKGIHGALWSALGQSSCDLTGKKILMAAAYEAGEEITAYVEPFAVGDSLPEMPLFLGLGRYILLPLEDTYQIGFESVPLYWRERITGQKTA